MNPIFKKWGWGAIIAVNAAVCLFGAMDARIAAAMAAAGSLQGTCNLILILNRSPVIRMRFYIFTAFSMLTVFFFALFFSQNLGLWTIPGIAGFLLMGPVFKFFS